MFGGFEIGRSRAPWWAIAALLAGALLFVLYSFIGTFVFGIFIYYATRPVYRRLKRRIRPPSLAATVAIFTLALPFLLLLAYTMAIALQEVDAFTKSLQEQQENGGTLGEFQKILDPYITLANDVQNPQDLLTNQEGLSVLTDVLNNSQQFIGIVGTGALHLFIMIALAFYLLRDGHKLSRWFMSTFGDDRGVLRAYLSAVDRDFRNIFFGNILNAFLTGVIGALSYSVLNVYAPTGDLAIPYAALVGLLAGAASLIPVVGMKLVYFPVSGWLFFQAFSTEQSGLLWFPILFVAVSFVIVDVIPDLVLRPYVSGRNLHVGAVMFAYIFGPLLFGWYGIFLGPMILVLSVHFAKLVLPELLHSEKLQPYAVDPTYFTPGDEAAVTDVSAATRHSADSDVTPTDGGHDGEHAEPVLGEADEDEE
ncbi:AI-2E family transporter [Haloarchaeobius sp. DYHT-AS-18]|uniref:AI-2E family transporter n=1 Tax=Haloarchaeobius sp. DYHT-AS-18 TaxID=3446117 RepID=UPI003EBAF0E4